MEAPSNASVADSLDRYALLLELSGESPFRVRAYQRAAEALRSLVEPLARLRDQNRLDEIPGVGRGITAAVNELLDTGTYRPLDELQSRLPMSLLDLLRVPGVGTKTATRLYQELGVADLPALEAAVADGRLRALSGMGKATEARIQVGLASLKRRTGRIRIGTALPMGRAIVAAVEALLPGAEASLAGSVRRMDETVADVDVVVAAVDPADCLSAVAQLPQIARVIQHRDGHLRAELAAGLPLDVFVVPRDVFGTELVRATGSGAHLAQLNHPLLEAPSEDEVYAAMGLPLIPPELRNGEDELAWASSGRLAKLVRADDVRGEFHAHTTWSDGTGSIAQMATAARACGYDFLGISDHTRSLGVANGLDETRLREQRRDIDLATGAGGIRLFRSAEVEVARDGRLDFDDATLASLDIVIASLHVGLRQPRAELTSRLLQVLRNPHVDVIAHPSGRLIEQREGGDFDWDVVFAAAAESGTALEINADPARLDLPADLARRALDAGCLLTINGDAHHPDGIGRLEYGIAVARRAGAIPEQILNCWSVEQIEAWLANRGGQT